MLGTSVKEVEPLILPSVNPSSGDVPAATHHRLLGLSLVAMSALTFSLMSTAVKFETAYMSSMETVLWRGLFCWSLNLAAIVWTRTSVRVQAELVPFVAFRCLVGFGSTAMCFWTFSQMPLADASCIIFINPTLTFLLSAALLGESLHAVDFGLAVLSFGGVLCVARPTFLFGQQTPVDAATSSPYAPLVGLLSASCQAMAYVTLRKTKSIHFLVIIHYFMLSGWVTAALWIVAFEQRTFTWQKATSAWAVSGATGALAFVGQLGLTKGFQLENAGAASMMRYLDIVFVFVWDAVILRESINWWSVVGAGVIISSAVAIFVRRAATAA